MDWLVHNSIAGMYGPHFLVFYGTMIVFIVAICWWWVRQADESERLPPLELPNRVDAYAVAYLRGGKNEVIRLAIFDLIQKGYLDVVDENAEAIDEKRLGSFGQKWINQTSSKPVHSELAPVVQTVWEWFHKPRKPDEAFNGELPARVEVRCKKYQQWVESESLKPTSQVRGAALQARFMGVLLIAGLGGYKLIVALSKGRYNVLFLILMGVVGLVFLFATSRLPPSESARKTLPGTTPIHVRRAQTPSRDEHHGRAETGIAAGDKHLWSRDAG